MISLSMSTYKCLTGIKLADRYISLGSEKTPESSMRVNGLDGSCDFSVHWARYHLKQWTRVTSSPVNGKSAESAAYENLNLFSPLN